MKINSESMTMADVERYVSIRDEALAKGNAKRAHLAQLCIDAALESIAEHWYHRPWERDL